MNIPKQNISNVFVPAACGLRIGYSAVPLKNHAVTAHEPQTSVATRGAGRGLILAGLVAAANALLVTGVVAASVAVQFVPPRVPGS